MKKVLPLHEGWRLYPARPGQLPRQMHFPAEGVSAQVPGTVHTDLLAAGLIPDPFYGANEQALQWVHQQDWVYRCQFTWPQELDPGRPVWLVCEGLDTVATVYWNGRPLGRSENMFLPCEFLLPAARAGEPVQLEVHLASPTRIAREREQRYGKLPAALYAPRVYLRKAQYSFGWDWGPTFPTLGIWRPVFLKQPAEAALRYVLFFTETLSDRRATVRMRVYWDRFSETPGDLSLHAVLEDAAGETVLELTRRAETSPAVLSGAVADPRPWFCQGLGEPYCYRLTVRLKSGSRQLDCWEGDVGLRKIELKRREGNRPSFRFWLNGEPLFAQGANWIPLDLFLPRVSEHRYREHLQLVQQAGMNFLRVWGGGIYEQPLFYRLCNQLGLLVWQDFMFACGAYPEYSGFTTLVSQEVRHVVRTLQHHPCMALWCGNNENEWNWYMEQGRPVEEMPGYRLFHELIPQILQEERIDQPYWPSTPFGESADPNDPATGNRHQWDIWSRWQDEHAVYQDRSLFLSEFGFQGPANPWTLEEVLPPEERHPQAPLMEYHNKQEEGPARLFRFLAAALPVHVQWSGFLYLTQLKQALALKTCFLHWRSRWPRCAGALVWQWNDCWPAISWSLVDSRDAPKAAYYAVGQALAHPAVTARWEAGQLHLHVFTTRISSFEGRLVLQEWDTLDNQKRNEQAFDVRWSEEVGRQEVKLSASLSRPQRSIWVYSLYGKEGPCCFQDFLSPVPLKHLHLWPVQIALNKTRETESELVVQLTAPALTIAVLLLHPRLIPETNLFLLFPGQSRTVRCRKRTSAPIPEKEIQVFCLNDWCFLPPGAE